jgi:hypothetical protein
MAIYKIGTSVVVDIMFFKTYEEDEDMAPIKSSGGSVFEHPLPSRHDCDEQPYKNPSLTLPHVGLYEKLIDDSPLFA